MKCKLKLILTLLLFFGTDAAIGSTIMFIGDSITKGTNYGHVTTQDTFAYKIGAANGYASNEIINRGVSSDTSGGLLNRLSLELLSYSPQVVVVMIGINDWANGVTVEQYKDNIHSIFQQLASGNIKVVGMTSNLQRGGTTDILSFQPYLQEFENEARSFNIPIVDLYREIADCYLYYTTEQFYALYVDNVHLTATGHQFVTDLAARPKYSGIFTAP